MSQRIDALFSLVPPSEIAAEIGADHGILSGRLLLEGRAERMVVTDISADSLSKARKRLSALGLSERAVFRVADGLSALDAPVSAIIIAGMGALAIRRILTEGQEKIGGAALVLQPNIDHAQLRLHLMEAGFRLDAERIVHENGRYYIAMRALRGEARYTPKELLLGPCLLRERPPLFLNYLSWRRDCLACSRGEQARMQRALVEEEMEGKL